MKPTEPKTVICQGCGVEFQTMGRYAKFCPDCRKMQSRRKKHDYYVRQRAMAQGKTEEEIRAEDEKAERLKANAGSLDSKLRECHDNGQSYAEAQRAETIEAFARVTAPEPSEPREAIESQEVPGAPEVPAGNEANMSMDPATKKALIRAQAKLEVLVEFFRAEGSDTIEFPGRVISEVVAALSEAVEEPEEGEPNEHTY